jgi:hypothetical protein
MKLFERLLVLALTFWMHSCMTKTKNLRSSLIYVFAQSESIEYIKQALTSSSQFSSRKGAYAPNCRYDCGGLP